MGSEGRTHEISDARECGSFYPNQTSVPAGWLLLMLMKLDQEKLTVVSGAGGSERWCLEYLRSRRSSMLVSPNSDAAVWSPTEHPFPIVTSFKARSFPRTERGPLECHYVSSSLGVWTDVSGEQNLLPRGSTPSSHEYVLHLAHLCSLHFRSF